jgi:hypothetical protein
MRFLRCGVRSEDSISTMRSIESDAEDDDVKNEH